MSDQYQTPGRGGGGMDGRMDEGWEEREQLYLLALSPQRGMAAMGGESTSSAALFLVIWCHIWVMWQLEFKVQTKASYSFINEHEMI